MNILLLSAMIAGAIEPGSAPVVEQTRDANCATDTQAIVVVADGSRSWSGAASAAIVDQLRSDVGPCRPVYVAWFDAEPRGDSAPATAQNRYVLPVPPRTPMKDAITQTLHNTVSLPVSAILVIAHEQIYPTYVRTDHLIASLKTSALPVHTIHLMRPTKAGSVSRRLRSGVSRGAVWTVEALIEEDRKAYSAGETGSMLKAMSEATNGNAYAAPDRTAGLGCADVVAARITATVPSS